MPNLEGNYLSLKKEDNHNKKQQVRLAAFFMKKDYKLSCFLAFLICSFTWSKPVPPSEWRR